MKRYYICPVKLYCRNFDTNELSVVASIPANIIGDKEYFYSAKIVEYPNYNYVSEIPNASNSDGRPKEDWCLIHVSTKNNEDFSDLDADSEFIFVSTNPLADEEVSVSSKLDKHLKDKKISITLKNKKTNKRELIKNIGKKLNINFHEDNFKVS